MAAQQRRNWTRYVRFVAVEDGQEHYGQPVDADIDVGVAVHKGDKVPINLLEGSDLPFDGTVQEQKTVHIAKLLPPLPRESIGGPIRCLGINFQKHVEEAKLQIPDVPLMFMKPPHSLAGPGDLPVPRFVHSAADEQLDFETELAVIMARDARDMKPEEVMDNVLGFTSANDVSARTEQLRQSQWNFGKGMDNACPIGPCVAVPSSSFDPLNTDFTGSLNGKVMQESNTSDHIFNVKKALSYLSSGTTLPKGAIVLLGTPAGVGWFRQPRTMLKNGDVFSVWHKGPIGTLINTIKFE